MNSLEQSEKFHSLLQQFQTAMLITADGEGRNQARPMAIAAIDPNCDLWFFTSTATHKAKEVEETHHAIATCQRDRDCYLSVWGEAELVTDKDKLAELWKEPFRVWFPEGTDDPDIALIHLIAKRGEYWDSQGLNKLRYMFEATKAYLTGSTPEIPEGQQHSKVHLNGHASIRSK